MFQYDGQAIRILIIAEEVLVGASLVTLFKSREGFDVVADVSTQHSNTQQARFITNSCKRSMAWPCSCCES